MLRPRQLITETGGAGALRGGEFRDKDEGRGKCGEFRHANCRVEEAKPRHQLVCKHTSTATLVLLAQDRQLTNYFSQVYRTPETKHLGQTAVCL